MPITDFSRTLMANGNIACFRAIKLDVSKKFNVLQATVGSVAEGDPCIGISGKGERLPPHVSDGFHAIAGEPCLYWADGANDVPAQIGVGGCTTGDKLKASTGGKLVPVAAVTDFVVAIAKQTGIEDDIIAVDVQLGNG